MARTAAWTPSQRLLEHMAAERSKLERAIAAAERRTAELEREIARLSAASGHHRKQLDELCRLGVARREDDRERVLRGVELRQTAVQLLASSSYRDRPLSYRLWFELLEQSGFTAAGKDPVATFLTEITRSPVVARTTRAGVYQLDFDFPRRARRELASLHSQREQHRLRPAVDVATLAAASSARRHIDREITRVERELREAVESLEGELLPPQREVA